MKCTPCFLAVLILLCRFALSQECACPPDVQSDLMRDLMIVDYWNHRINERLPVTYDHFLRGGYINMPSARMGKEGEIGFGYSRVPPYINYNLRVQMTPRLEISGNYRIFQGVEDPILSPLGFGDLSDKGANIKFAILHPEDSDYTLPGISVGYDDFIGTQSFRARYIVLTQVFLDYDAEISFGYGNHRIHRWFGGMSWMPFRRCGWDYFKGLSLVTEYDATPYEDKDVELHPKGRKSRSPVNIGMKYRLWDQLDCSLSYVRGHAWAFSVSGFYNFGETQGFIPKIGDPLPYSAPVNIEPLGLLRPEDVLVQDLVYPLREQGFDLLETWLSYDNCRRKNLQLRVLNNSYLRECDVRNRLNHIIEALIPNDIDDVIVTIEGDGCPIQEYRYKMEYMRQYRLGLIGINELNLLNPLREATYPNPLKAAKLFKSGREWFNFEVLPKNHMFFGSSRGKLKYSFGIYLGINGFLYGDLFYNVLLGCNAFTNINHMTGVDRLNPSQIINVRTDIVEYYKQKGLTIDEAYMQKNWNLGRGWFARLSAGLFEEEYGGIASEFLYFPVKSNWAFGVEGAYLRKRTHRGVGFTRYIRKLDGFVPHYKKFVGKQYFLNFYYNWDECNLDFQIKAGKFLANDWGARFELCRYFSSGLQLGVWYTYTNAHDRINGKTYHDKGVIFSMPLDIFYTHSERERFGYGMSAWLRDVGVVAENGRGLFEMINAQRE